MVLVVRTDLKMGKGKIAAQVILSSSFYLCDVLNPGHSFLLYHRNMDQWDVCVIMLKVYNC